MQYNKKGLQATRARDEQRLHLNYGVDGHIAVDTVICDAGPLKMPAR